MTWESTDNYNKETNCELKEALIREKHGVKEVKQGRGGYKSYNSHGCIGLKSGNDLTIFRKDKKVKRLKF